MRRTLLLIAIVLVLAVVFGLLLHTVAREAVRSALIRAYDVVRTVLSAIPEPYYWGFLILVIVVSALHSIVGDEGQSLPAPLHPAGGRTAEWRDWLTRAAQPARYRPFYRWLVARSLAKLSSEIVAYQESIPPGEAERLIENGDVVLPPAVRDYFLTSMRSRPTRGGIWRARLSRSQPHSPLDLDPTQAVDLIETQMEVPHDNRHP